jgi:hypothetical protein
MPLGIIVPTTPRQLRRMNMELFGTGETPIKKVRKIVVTRAGGWYRAHYSGRNVFVMARDENDARSRLKSFDKGKGYHDGTLPRSLDDGR